jgi:pimeloyl-ACP methyl ester carboxylesterase
MRNAVWLLLAAAFGPLAGCADPNAEYLMEERKAKGLVVILPGIEGESELNHNIRRGLVDAGVPCALPIYPWGRPIPIAGILINQMDFIGNRLAGIGIARTIASYQDAHPHSPVYVIGHSGGGGVAVFTAEALADMEGDHRIEGLVLLSASISGDYDLTKAIGRCRQGIVNFYNRGDVAMLAIGTTLAGNVDGGRSPSAGRAGFIKPSDSIMEKRRDVFSKLFQVELTEQMHGGDDPHASTTRPSFVSRYVAPWVVASSWPAGSAEVFAAPNNTPTTPGGKTAGAPVRSEPGRTRPTCPKALASTGR